MSFYSPLIKHCKMHRSDQSGLPHKDSDITITKIVSISTSMFDEMINIYRWRAETQFPILKVKIGNVVFEEVNSQNSTKQLQVIFQEPAYKFFNFTQIPLFKVLYLLKQSLIGLERLFAKFGSFILSENIIFVDRIGKCKVWINAKVQSNEFIKSEQKQCEFLLQTYQLFEKKTSRTKQSNIFYEKIKSCKSFFSALQYIDSFVEKFKINVPSNFKQNPSLSTTTSLEKKKKKIDFTQTMSKRPDFLSCFDLNENKQQKLQQFKSKYECINSAKLIHKYKQFSKFQMKNSENTAAQSQKNTNRELKDDFKKLFNEKDELVWNSGKREKTNKIRYLRKFSNNTTGPSSPTIQVHAPVSFPSPSFNLITQLMTESIIFGDNQNQKYSSRSSSSSNKQKLIEKKKEIFNQNGWNLKVKSLFAEEDQMKQSYYEQELVIGRMPIKLDSLDKCTPNLSESYMVDNEME